MPYFRFSAYASYCFFYLSLVSRHSSSCACLNWTNFYTIIHSPADLYYYREIGKEYFTPSSEIKCLCRPYSYVIYLRSTEASLHNVSTTHYTFIVGSLLLSKHYYKPMHYASLHTKPTDHRTAVEPVSYTHLDVYKRQDIYNIHNI